MYDRIMNDYHVALGANLPSGEGSPIETLKAALDLLSRSEMMSVVSVSAFYRTPCFPPGTGPDYVNAAAHLRSTLAPQEVLAALHEIEARFGRERKERWGMRTLDLDLIAAGDAVLPDLETHDRWRTLAPESQKSAAPDNLILPHPRVQDRAFVLVPLRDIAAEWVHPVLNRTVEEMCSALAPEDLAQIVVLET